MSLPEEMLPPIVGTGLRGSNWKLVEPPSAGGTCGDKRPPPAPASPSWRERLKAGLSRTRAQFGGKLKSIFARGKVDDELLDELETLLLTSDALIAEKPKADDKKAGAADHDMY